MRGEIDNQGSQFQANDFGLRDEVVILKAGVEKRVDFEGDYFFIQDCVQAFAIKFNDGNPVTRTMGDGLPVKYGKLTLTSVIDQTVTISVGYTNGVTPVSSAAAFVGTVTVQPLVGANLNNSTRPTIAAGVSQQFLAASATRLGWVIGIPDTAGDGLRIGTAGLTAANGLAIPLGTRKITETISPRAAVFIFNGTPNPVTFDRLEQLP